MQNSVGISLFVTIVMLSRCSSLVTRRMLRPATTVGSSSSSLSSTSNSGIALNARDVREKIEAKCKELGRDPSEVLLVPVSKTKPNENIMEFISTPEIKPELNKINDKLLTNLDYDENKKETDKVTALLDKFPDERDVGEMIDKKPHFLSPP